MKKKSTEKNFYKNWREYYILSSNWKKFPKKIGENTIFYLVTEKNFHKNWREYKILLSNWKKFP